MKTLRAMMFFFFCWCVPHGLGGEPGSYWLQSYGLEFWEWDVDHDNDGYTAREEYAAGTDPFSVTSLLELAVAPSGPDIQLSWNSKSGVLYQLQGATNISMFGPLLAPIPGSGSVIDVLIGPSLQTLFYRLTALFPVDLDNDGLSALEEALIGANPLVSDSDRDGILDGDELFTYGTDPTAATVFQGTISGTLYFDLNGDGNLNDGEVMADQKIFLDENYNGQFDEGERTTLTDTHGFYRFYMIPPGLYHVRQLIEAPTIQTYPEEGIAPVANLLPDEVVEYIHALPGVGNFDVPYGENASDWPGNWFAIELGPGVEIVSSVDLVLKPIGRRAEVPGLGTYNRSEFLSLPQDASITVRFDEAIVDRDGPDLVIHSINGANASEQLEVFLGATLSNLVSIGIVDQTGAVELDLTTFHIPSPVHYVKVVSQNNGGDWFGYDLVGFEALHIAPPFSSAHRVTMIGNEQITGRDFGRFLRDLPPRIFISATSDGPGPGLRAGETLDIHLTAVDDIGITSRSLFVNGQPILLDISNRASVAVSLPGTIHIEATTTDTSAQHDTAFLDMIVLNENGTYPFNPNIVGAGSATATNAPQARILIPGPGASVTSNESIIATISGVPAATSWTLEYAPVDDVDPQNLAAVDLDYIALATGTGNVFGTSLATFPTASLSNGIYFLRLTASSGIGKVAYYGHAIAKGVSEADLRPQITIHAPSSGTEVHVVQAITGTVTSTRPVVLWYAEYAIASDVDLNNLADDRAGWTRFAEGTGTFNNALIGTFDATRLPSDSYVLRIVARNDIGLGWAEPLALEAVGEAKLGRLRLVYDDLSIDLAGFPLTFSRIYDSLRANINGELGYGWALQFQDADIRETVPDTGSLGLFGSTPFRDGTRVYITSPEGRRLGFTFKPVAGPASLAGPLYRATFEPDPGVYEKLEVPQGDQAFLALRPDGSVYLYFFNFPWNPSKYVLTDRQGRRYTYDENAGFLEAVDLNDNRITRSENAIKHSAGLEVRFTRDGAGRITAITDPESRVWTCTYDGAGNFASITDPETNTTTYSYFTDPAHYLEFFTDDLGRVPLRYEYDADGRLAAVVDHAGNRREVTWDPEGFTGSVTDGNGHTRLLEYDARGNTTRITDPKGHVIELEYTDPLNPDLATVVTDPRGGVWTVTYDSLGNPTRIVTPDTVGLNGRYDATFDAFGRMTSADLPDGSSWEFEYDAEGNLVRRLSPIEPEQFAEFTPEGLLASYRSDDSYTAHYTYDTKGHLSGISDITGLDFTVAINRAGLPTEAIDTFGSTSEFEFDVKGRLIRQADAEGREIVVTELPDGTLQTVDRNGDVSSFVSDPDGKPTFLSAACCGDVAVTYDGNRNLASVTDPLGNLSTYTYDSTSFPTNMTDAVGAEKVMTYDPSGNVVEIIDRNGKRRTFSYNGIGSLTQERWHDGTSIVRTITFAYTAGRLASVLQTVGNVTSRWSFGGSLPQITQARYEYPGQQVFNVNYSWSDNSVRQTAPSLVGVYAGLGFRGQLTAGYFGGRCQEIQLQHPDGSGNRIEIRRDAQGMPIDLRRFTSFGGSGYHSKTLYGHDLHNRIVSVLHEDKNGVLIHTNASMTITRDAENRVTGITHAGNTATMSYDTNRQLAAVSHSNPSYPDETYSYDVAGNRLTSHSLNTSAVVQTGNRMASIGNLAFLYDAEGNMIRRTDVSSGEVTEFTYDHRNRMVLATVHPSLGGPTNHSVAFEYDYLDRLASRDIDGVKTWILYDRTMPIAEFLNNSNQLSAMFLYTPDGIDDVHMVWRDGIGEHWLMKDHLGSVRGILNDTGALLSWVDYDAFGNIQGTPPANLEPVRFAGRPYVAELNLYENRRRLYDPVVGRFISEDPLSFAGGDFNLYRYVSNDPLNLIDPYGTSATEYALLVLATARPAAFCSFASCIGRIWETWVEAAATLRPPVNSDFNPNCAIELTGPFVPIFKHDLTSDSDVFGIGFILFDYIGAGGPPAASYGSSAVQLAACASEFAFPNLGGDGQ